MRRASSRGYRRYDESIALGIRLGVMLTLASLTLLFAAPAGYRLGLLSLPVAAGRVFVWGANLAGGAAVVSSLGLLTTLTRRRDARQGLGRAALAILTGVLAFWAGGQLPLTTPPPPLSDVTTDTLHPPEYVTVAKLRSSTAATVDLSYAGERLASRQQEAYQDLQPLVLTLSRDEAFSRALAAVRTLGWTLVAADGDAGRIEASAVARLFGAVDDVIIRVTAADGGSRVDVRSTAREPGGSTAATRVRAVLAALKPQ